MSQVVRREGTAADATDCPTFCSALTLCLPVFLLLTPSMNLGVSHHLPPFTFHPDSLPPILGATPQASCNQQLKVIYVIQSTIFLRSIRDPIMLLL